MPHRLMITVDVEAFPKRAEKDHVERLIWGRYPDGNGGIGEMMSIAEKHGVKLVMFLDYVEEFLYGEELLNVARIIHARGHDLQLHSHPELFPDSFWAERGIDRLKNVGGATDAQADALFEFLCDSQIRATGVTPIAYRGGGYRYGAATVRAMGTHGIRLNSSYVATSDNQTFKAGPLPQFKWDNGCVEAPVSCLHLYKGQTKLYHLNFNHSTCTDVERMMVSLQAFYRQMGDQALAVMVMHSWSFSNELEDGYFSTPRPERIELFDKFLGAIAGKIEVVDSRTALALIDSKHLPVEGVVAIDAMDSGAAALNRGSTIAAIEDRTCYFRRLSYLDSVKLEHGRWKWYLNRARSLRWGGKLKKLLGPARSPKAK